LGSGEEDKGNGNYKSRSLRDDNQKNNGKCKCNSNGKSEMRGFFAPLRMTPLLVGADTGLAGADTGVGYCVGDVCEEVYGYVG
jgi:hypothetical protein